MNTQCSRCHTTFNREAGNHETPCPKCGALAGLEELKSDYAPPIRNFAVLIGIVLFSAFGSVIWTLLG